jgi:hypothetical protein
MKRKNLNPNLDELILELIHVWRKFLKINGPQDHLQTREFRSVVEEIKKFRGASSFKTREALAAYCLYYFPLHYAEGLSLLGELPFTPKRVLDLFSGPAPFSLAAMEFGASEVVALDENADALRLGAEILGRQGYTFTQRVWNWPKPIGDIGLFDLIILGYTPDIPNNIFDYLTDEGCILVVDSSWPEANNKLLKLRDEWVEKGLHVVAPCIYKGKCPALLQKAPCFAQREYKKPHLMAEIQRSAEINLSSLKMSYLIVSKKSYIDTQEPLYRVVSPALQTRFGKRYSLCGQEGYKSLGTRLKEHPKETKAFDYLQRGDVVLVKDAFISKDTFEIIENTQLTVESAVGKPIPFKYQQKSSEPS